MVTSHAYAYESATSRLPVFARATARHGKITCNVWAPEWLGGPGAFETESDPHLALFHSMDRCFATLAAWHWRDDRRRAPRLAAAGLSQAGAADAAARMLAAIPDVTLTERQAKHVMALYGIPVVQDQVVQDANAAVAAAVALGFPVVLKGESPDVLHKTEAGLVRLDLRSEAAVQEACQAILTAAAAMIEPAIRLQGVLVQPMVPQGVEIMVGARYDPQFGPLVVVGLGGVLVELLRDTAVALAPVGPAEALSMLDRLQGAALLDGFRGAPPVDRARLADVICRLSELAADAGASIVEMEINPLICAGEQIIAVDALIVKAAP